MKRHLLTAFHRPLLPSKLFWVYLSWIKVIRRSATSGVSMLSSLPASWTLMEWGAIIHVYVVLEIDYFYQRTSWRHLCQENQDQHACYRPGLDCHSSNRPSRSSCDWAYVFFDLPEIAGRWRGGRDQSIINPGTSLNYLKISLTAAQCSKTLIVASSTGNYLLRQCTRLLIPALVEFIGRVAPSVHDGSITESQTIAVTEIWKAFSTFFASVAEEKRKWKPKLDGRNG